MKQSGNRGAARVSAVWLISAIVAALVAIVFAFIAYKDRALAEEQAAEARREEAVRTDSLQATTAKMATLSEPLGWYKDPDALSKETDLASMTLTLGELRDAFNLDASYDTIQDMVPELISRYDARRQKIVELEGRINTLDTEIASVREEVTETEDSKQKIIDGLNSDLQDEKDNARTRQSELEDDVDQLRDQVTDLDTDNRSLRGIIEERDLQVAEMIRTHEARLNNMNAALKPFREPLRDRPDATVLEVSEELPMGWIDIGANNRLTVGTSFDVYSGTVGSQRLKARATVTRTEARKAEVTFTNVTSRYDGVVPGDILVNPLYDPSGEHNAVLLGRFSAPYDERDLTALLDRIGITVQENLDLTTHYLIVGGALYTDEDGLPLDEPQQPSELGTYRDAEALGVVILPVQQLRGYFKL